MTEKIETKTSHQRRVCASCKEPWKGSQDICKCGSKDSEWADFDSVTGEIKSQPARIVSL